MDVSKKGRTFGADMKIDSYNKLITVESMTDEVSAMNYLFVYLTAEERKGWKIRNTTKRNEKRNNCKTPSKS